jgi:hypothetical protein
MKKLIASVLCISIAVSLAACGGKQQETTIPESSETTRVTETTEATTVTTVETTTTATTVKILSKEDYVINAHKKYKKYVKGDSEDDFYAPEFLIKSAYADSINAGIKKLFEGYKKELKKKNCDIECTEYIVYLTKEGILTVVFREVRKNDIFRIYNIDVTTGEKVDNARIAEIAGVKDIKKAARDALQKYYNNAFLGFEFKDYKVVKKKGKKLTNGEKKAQATFDEKYINDNIAIGLTDEGKMLFILTVWDDCYEKSVYDIDGTPLRVDNNPSLVTSPVSDD